MENVLAEHLKPLSDPPRTFTPILSTARPQTCGYLIGVHIPQNSLGRSAAVSERYTQVFHRSVYNSEAIPFRQKRIGPWELELHGVAAGSLLVAPGRGAEWGKIFSLSTRSSLDRPGGIRTLLSLPEGDGPA